MLQMRITSLGKLTSVKTADASFSDSPYHLSFRLDPWRLMNLHPASLAMALAIMVLPHPGGPYSNTPVMEN